MSTAIITSSLLPQVSITLQTTLNSQLARGLGAIRSPALFSFAAGAFSLGSSRCCVADYSPRLRPFHHSLCGVWPAADRCLRAVQLHRARTENRVVSPAWLAIVGQLLSSQVIDHFGLLGTIQRPVSLIKLGGMLLC